MLTPEQNTLPNNQPDKLILARSFAEFDIREIPYVTSKSFTTFEDLLKNGFCIDKTRHYMSLICGGKKIFMFGESGVGKTVTLSAIDFLAQGQIAKEQLSGYNITSHHWENEHGNYLDEHGCPIHIQNDVLLKNSTFYPFKKYPVIHIDFEDVLHLDKGSTVLFFYKMLQTKADRYNVGHLYNLEESEYQATNNFVQLIRLLTNLGQGYERRVIILLDNVDHFSEYHVVNGKRIENGPCIASFIKAFYKAIRSCSNDIHTVLAFGGYLNEVDNYMREYGHLSDAKKTSLCRNLFGVTKYELENSFTDDLLVKCFNNKYTDEEQRIRSNEEKKNIMVEYFKKNMELKNNKNIYNTGEVIGEIYRRSNLK